MLTRFPEWEVDLPNAKLSSTSTVRGWETMPAIISDMKPAPFDYHVPATAAEAVSLLAELGDEAKVLAGGQSLIPMLALRLAVFDHLVDIGRIDELVGIERRNGDLWIGAGTTDAAVGASAEVAAAVPLLTRATPFIGHFQIRNRGTLGGSIAHADPAAEYPAVALALDATHGRRSRRAGAATIAARRLLRRAVEHDARTRRAARRRVVPGLDRAAAASPSRSSPAATATSPSPAPPSASSSTATTASPAAPSG